MIEFLLGIMAHPTFLIPLQVCASSVFVRGNRDRWLKLGLANVS